MDYTRLGSSGLNVSKICLGTMMFGDQTSEVVSAKIVSLARDAGVNFIDTADMYSMGDSERITGKTIRRDRHDWVLATKVGSPMGTGILQRGISRKWIMKACDDSLGRLGTDHIDLYYLHADDPDMPAEEPVRAMADLIQAGKICHWGVSNLKGWRIAQMAGLCDNLSVPRPAVCQPYYNAMNRMPEVDILPACKAFNIGVVPFSPLARGVLTGKYDPNSKPEKGSRAGRGDQRMLNSEWRKESLIIAQKIKKHAAKKGMTPVDFAVNWVLNNRLVTSVIAGPRTLAQWKSYLNALKHEFSAEDEAFIDTLVAAGHPSTPGYNDPKHPVIGREALTSYCVRRN
jgi:aryl-alcohol dehydrogenase-like predicted oxidoreductase